MMKTVEDVINHHITSAGLAKAAQIRFDNLAERHKLHLHDEYKKQAAVHYANYLHHTKAAEILKNEITN